MTTPHPTDALPLPDLPTTSYLGDGNGYGYDSSDMYAYGLIVRREGYELAMQALAAPIHDPAVTTPREVLVGESPVDRIAAPAQEQSVEDEAQALIDAGHAFWNSCKSLGGGAVRWLQCEDGTLIIFARGEYRERLMSRICADYSAPQYVYQSGEWQALSAEPKQQAGSAEVSDEQIDSILWIGERATPEKLRKFARKVLALKAGGVA